MATARFGNRDDRMESPGEDNAAEIPERPSSTSGTRRIERVGAPSDVGSPSMNAIIEMLHVAIRAGLFLRLVLRTVEGRPDSIRLVEGQPYEIRRGRDGRDRVTVRVAESTEQIVPLDRVLNVVFISS